MEVDMLFTPRAVQSYEFVVPLVIDGSTVVRVLVGGQGIVPKIELADPTKVEIWIGDLLPDSSFGCIAAFCISRTMAAVCL
eukprot:50207-Eustigmatos_ZCMA.PRE.1